MSVLDISTAPSRLYRFLIRYVKYVYEEIHNKMVLQWGRPGGANSSFERSIDKINLNVLRESSLGLIWTNRFYPR